MGGKLSQSARQDKRFCAMHLKYFTAHFQMAATALAIATMPS